MMLLTPMPKLRNATRKLTQMVCIDPLEFLFVSYIAKSYSFVINSCLFPFLYACVLITVILYAEAASCLERAVNIFCEIGRLNMAARYYKVLYVSFEHELDITLFTMDTEKI